MESFYYLPCGRAVEGGRPPQIQERRKSRWRIGSLQGIKKTCYLLVTRFLVVGQTKPIPKALLG